VLLANNREVQLRGVLAGLGIGHLPRYLAEGHPALVRVSEDPPLTREIWMGIHQDSRNAPRIMAVQDAIADAIVQSRALLLPA
jgi:DNA-binding transcriptional LysR family regulator